MNKSRKFAALILITVILSGFCQSLRAQEEEDDEPHGLYLEQPRVFYGGLVAGANFSQVDGDYFAGYRKIGANVGGIVYAQLARHVALSMEILYSQKGSKAGTADLPQPSSTLSNVYITAYSINNNYAEVPIMINYFDKRRSHFGAGFSYSRLVTSNEILQIDSSGTQRNIDFNLKYPFAKNNLDFLVGAELHLWKGLFLNVRFQYSMLPIRKDIPPDYARASQYNNMWVVRVMYLLK
jgi:hypothetical protein